MSRDACAALRVVAFVTVLTVSPANSAHAECAWTLWEQSTTINAANQPPVLNIGPTLLGAFDTFSACTSASQRKAEEDARAYSAVGTTQAFAVTTGGWRVMVDYRSPKQSLATTYLCYPET